MEKQNGPSISIDSPTERNILAMFRAGSTEQQVADHFGVSRSTIRRTLERAGEIRPSDRVKPRVTSEVREEAIQELREGGRLEEVAERFGISRATLCRYSKEAGLRLRTGRPGASEESVRLAIQAVRNGSSAKEAAQRFGVSRTSLGRILQGEGVPVKMGRPRELK